MRSLPRLALLGIAALLPSFLPPSAAASAAEGIILYANSADSVQDSYIVVLRDSVSAAALTAKHGGRLRHTFGSVLHGFSATMSERAARRLAADPAVAYVQQDTMLKALDTQPNPPSWGLDRIDQPRLPLDQSYTYASASNVDVFVIDSGIRLTHQSFGGRAVWGVNTTGDGNNTDCYGHGTHVAATIGGTQYGVAKDVRLIAVKVLGCTGSGTTSGIVAGIDWVTQHAVRPSVANISFGAPGVNAAMENAIRASIASGVTYVVASGNSNANACNFTPARVPEAITVNASDINDNKASFSNYGACTDLFAPGVSITSAWGTGDTAVNTLSGTSMSAAHVSGAAALWLADNPTSRPPDILLNLTRDMVLISNWDPVMVSRKLLISPWTPLPLLAPDLVVGSVNANTGYVEILNLGVTATSAPFYIALYDGSQLVVYPQNLQPIRPSEPVSFYIDQLRRVNCGLVELDAGHQIPETRENNNGFSPIGPCLH